ncbi:MAG: hypothetical protein F4Y60_13715 [Boseongicola sp. SB0664_bin_43]|uniref:Uncharacterized protein n=1 Tax=Boseongicola sp. SB0664_bin_43 TaxID=2604844 RepID=A0A6B0Y607_9RHOB|nr:hypothetical protein [Boseongicola sp. SB0664_bin_43]
MHVVRGNLSPAEANLALSNLAEASISTVLSAAVEDFVDWCGPISNGGVAAIFLDDLASREAHPGVAANMLLVHDGERVDDNERLYRQFRAALTDLAQDNLLLSPVPRRSKAVRALPLSGLKGHVGASETGEVPVLTRARCFFECGDLEIGRRFGEAQRAILEECGDDDALLSKLRKPPKGPAEADVSTFVQARGGLEDVERAARILQLTETGLDLDDPAPSAAAVFAAAGAKHLEEAAGTWRGLQGVVRLVGEDGFDVTEAGEGVKSLVASACGQEDFAELNAAVAETARRSAEEIDTLMSRVR